jgi:large subunit ribosomal protein L29
VRPSEIRDLSDDEIKHKVDEFRQELFNLKVQNSTGQLENNSRISKVKKDIARILTIIRERALAARK